MAETYQSAGAAIVANAAAVGVAASLTTAEATAVGNFLIAAGRLPGLANQILRLVNTTELTENRP